MQAGTLRLHELRTFTKGSQVSVTALVTDVKLVDNRNGKAAMRATLMLQDVEETALLVWRVEEISG